MAVVKGAHTVDMTIDPPPNGAGQPFDHYGIKMCINGTTFCFVRDTDVQGAAPAARRLQSAPSTTFSYTVTDDDCAADATNCLRANTAYMATARAVKADGKQSRESVPKTFRTGIK